MWNKLKKVQLPFFFSENQSAWKWISLAIVLKGILFIFFARNLQGHPGFFPIFNSGGDTYEYYPPIESLVNGNGFGLCRMPGLLPIYAPLFFLFGSDIGRDLVILLQFLMGAVSVYFLAQMAKEMFASHIAFLLVFFLYALSSFVSIWDHYGMADSFSVSMLIISSFYFFRGLHSESRVTLFLSGVLLAWSIFFRPITGTVWILFCLLLFLKKSSFKRNMIRVFLFSMPFVLADSIWVTRNYIQYHVVVPFEVTPEMGVNPTFDCKCQNCLFTPQLLELRKLVVLWGGQVFCNEGSEGIWLYGEKKIMDPVKSNPFSENIYTKAYDFDSLLVLRANYYRSVDVTLSKMERDSFQGETIRGAKEYALSFKKEKPLQAYFLNKIKMMYLFINEPLDYRPVIQFLQMKGYHKLIGWFYIFLLKFVSLFGLFGIIVAFFTKKKQTILPALIPLGFIFMLSAILGFRLYRYFVPVYPFLLMYAAYFLFRMILLIRRFSFNLASAKQ